MDLHGGAAGVGKARLDALALEGLNEDLAALARLVAPVRHSGAAFGFRG